jgi:hypothetical protein
MVFDLQLLKEFAEQICSRMMQYQVGYQTEDNGDKVRPHKVRLP